MIWVRKAVISAVSDQNVLVYLQAISKRAINCLNILAAGRLSGRSPFAKGVALALNGHQSLISPASSPSLPAAFDSDSLRGGKMVTWREKSDVAAGGPQQRQIKH